MTITAKTDLPANHRVPARGAARTIRWAAAARDAPSMATSCSASFAPRRPATTSSTRPIACRLPRPKPTFPRTTFRAAAAIDGKEKTGWAIGGQTGRDHAIVFVHQAAARPAAKSRGCNWCSTRIRAAAHAGAVPPDGHDRQRSAVGRAQEHSRHPGRGRGETVGRADNGARRLFRRPRTRRRPTWPSRSQAQGAAGGRPVMTVRMIVQRTSEPRKSHCLHRGDFLHPEDEVQPGTLAVLPPLAPRRGGAADRLDLARWLVDPANPLTRRVLANHLWAQPVWPRHRAHAGRFRRARRAAHASRAARLVGRRTGRARLEPQGDDPARSSARPPIASRRPMRTRRGRCRSAQRPVAPPEPLSRRGRDRARPGAGDAGLVVPTRSAGQACFRRCPPTSRP